MNSSFDLGFISIHYYSICLFLAIILGGYIVIKESKKFFLQEDLIINLLFFTIIFGILGARIYFILFNLNYYLDNPEEIIMVWHGGLAIHGGIVGGLIAIIVYCFKNKLDILKILDIIVPGLILAQAIGRWGNFFNAEAHGPLTTLNFLESLYLPKFIIEGMNINGYYYIPTFLYESLWCIVGFIILIIVRKLNKIKVGQILSLYLVWYGIGRFIIEGLRTDSLMFLDLKMAQIISLFMIIIGLFIFIFMMKKGEKYNKEVKS